MGINTEYDGEWFKKRAFESLVSIAPHTWDYSDSLLLYISSGVEKYESIQESDSPYFNLVTKPEREYHQYNAIIFCLDSCGSRKRSAIVVKGHCVILCVNYGIVRSWNLNIIK